MAPFDIPPTVYKDSNFSTISQTFVIFFNSTHPNGCEVASHCGFDLHFLND